MRFLLYLIIFNLTSSSTTSSNDPLTKFNIIIKTPGSELPPTRIPYKSIHVKYTLSNSDDQWNIVAIEPFIRLSNGVIQEMTVRLCQTSINTYQSNPIWYDDDDGTNCNSARSMLLYQWTSYSSLSTFRISDDVGFQLDKSKSIVLTVTYFKERRLHNDRSGILLHISTLMPSFHIGTLLVGNQRRGIRFSCRSSNYPRLLYAIKPSFSQTDNVWWRIYIVRNRHFGRKLIQPVLDSTLFVNENQTDIEILSSDIFLTIGDFIIIECTQISELNCKFLIFYTFKTNQDQYSDENDHICQDNNYPELFKLIPTRTMVETSQAPPHVSNMDGTTIFLLICMLLFIIWISIIIGCIVMRRIRGLVNFRTQPSTPFSYHTTKAFFPEERSAQDQNQQRVAAEGDQIAQLDIEHMGLMT